MKKYIPVGGIILFFTLINISAFLIGFANTPPGRVFTGAVHYPPDYYYYLSFIAQGATRWFTNFQLFNAETTIPELIGWFYTFSGHILLPIFRSQVIVYQVLTVAGSLFYLIASFLFIRKLLPHRRGLQIFVFILFLTSSTMPLVSYVNGQFSYTYITSWYNFGDPFERLTNIPHHLLFEGSAFLAFIAALDWWRKKSRLWQTALVMAVTGFILASNQPVLWLEITIVLGCIGILTYKNNGASSLLPAIVLGTTGLPFVLYLKFYLFTMPPYNALTIWEPTGQISITALDYIKLNGPLVVTALLGLPLWLRSMSREKLALTLMTALSLLIFFSPIPARVSILNIRFLSVFPTLLYASVTGFAIWTLFQRFAKLRIVLTLIAAILIAHAIPLTVQPLLARNGLFVPDNSWDYIPLEVSRTFKVAEKISRHDDMFFVMYPYDGSFVGLTGRRIYTSYSNPLWRVNFEEKQKHIDALYGETSSDEEKAEFLRSSHLAYIISYSSMTSPYSGLIPVYRNNVMTIYKVPAL